MKDTYTSRCRDCAWRLGSRLVLNVLYRWPVSDHPDLPGLPLSVVACVGSALKKDTLKQTRKQKDERCLSDVQAANPSVAKSVGRRHPNVSSTQAGPRRSWPGRRTRPGKPGKKRYPKTSPSTTTYEESPLHMFPSPKGRCSRTIFPTAPPECEGAPAQ